MSDLLIGLMGVMLATNQPVALSNLVAHATGLSLPVSNPADPVAQELRDLMAMDDQAHDEIDQWIQAQSQSEKEPDLAQSALLKARIRHRLDEVRLAYQRFIERHPLHVEGRIAYASFLLDTDDDEEGEKQLEKARELDPKNPAAWNNLANHYGHKGPVTKAFEYYQKAIELNPTEPVYYHNYATTVYLFRMAATNYFHLSEAEVFDKAMGLYDRALELDPNNFLLAADVAQSYYGIKLPKTDDPAVRRAAEVALGEKGIAAWERALTLARDDIERQGVYVHLARNQIRAGRPARAREELARVNDPMFDPTKAALMRKIQKQEAGEEDPVPEKTDPGP